MIHYEIALSPLERECLKRTMGFKIEMPTLVSSEDFKKKKYLVEPWHIVPDSEKYNRAYSEVEKVRKENVAEREKIRKKYPKIKEEKGLTMREATERFFAQFTKEDLERHDQLLMYNNSVIYNRAGQLTHNEHDRKRRFLRKLYGIIGIVQGEARYPNKYFYKHFILPSENAEAARQSIETGAFVKELEIEDLFLLEFLLERTKEIKKGKTKGLNPRFSLPRIVKEYGGENRMQISERLNRLTGILCHTYGPQGTPYYIKGRPKHVYWDNWYIPFKNFKLAEKTIERR